jgi:hypothetical protein
LAHDTSIEGVIFLTLPAALLGLSKEPPHIRTTFPSRNRHALP